MTFSLFDHLLGRGRPPYEPTAEQRTVRSKLDELARELHAATIAKQQQRQQGHTR